MADATPNTTPSQATAEEKRRRQLLELQRTQKGIKNTGKALETAGTATQVAGKTTQATGKGVELAGKGMQAAGKGIDAAGTATTSASQGLAKAGVALSETGLGAIVGVPMAVIGGAGMLAGTAAKGAGKATQATGKGVESAGKATQTAGKGIDKAGKAASQAGGQMKRAGSSIKKAQSIPQLNVAEAKSNLQKNIFSAQNRGKGFSPTKPLPNMPQKGTNTGQLAQLQIPQQLTRNPLANQIMKKPAANDNEEFDQEEAEEQENTQEDVRAQQNRSMIEQAVASKEQEQQAENQGGMPETEPKQILNKIVGEASTVDPTFISKILWLDILWLYGKKIKKGTSKVIPSISWDDVYHLKIMNFVDKNGIMLDMFMFFLNILVLFIVLITLLIIALIIYALLHPLESAKMFLGVLS